MKIKVCKGCGEVQISPNGCPICYGINKDSGIMIEVEIDETKLQCPYCKKYYNPKTSSYKEPPFANYKTMSYYCGCRGWD
jgi:hypothetical protein